MTHAFKSIAIGAALFTLTGVAGCGGDDPGPLGNVDSLIVLQRPKRNAVGDIFDYESYVPGARLVQLSPPTADGKLTTICCTAQGADYAQIDISGYDISFDAKSIVFAGKLKPTENYGLFLLQLADGSVTQLMTDPGRNYVDPIFIPGNKIMFTTSAVVEQNAQQHDDEYERRVTIQLGRINVDGTGIEYGPRNLSHRTLPSLASDGRVIFTQWDHLGEENSGHLMFVNQDMQELREAYGKEGQVASNSVLKAREISPGRFVGVATSRDRTFHSGALIDIRLGKVETKDGVVSASVEQSEKNSTFKNLTPDVPTNNDAAAETIGRYYDAYPLNAKDKPDLLVSWSDGPVSTEIVNPTTGLYSDFGIYLYDSANKRRRPILNDPEMWDLYAMPLRTRSVPPVVASAQDPRLAGQTLLGSLDVYNSSLHQFARGSIYGVRVMEGFSSEEGCPDDFGTTMHEGHANLGVAKVADDGSWSAKIPANIPIHVQAVDMFGMSLFNEPVWFSGRPGEARMCGGCHEDRTRTTNVTPGQLETFSIGASQLHGLTPRAQRRNAAGPAVPAPANLIGVPWDTLIQPILTAKCVSCHGNDNTAGIAPYTITDENGVPYSWTFNLTGDALPPEIAVAAGGQTFSKSYFSMVGPEMEAIDRGDLTISGNFKVYLKPLDSRGSIAIQKLNPLQVFPEITTTRAFPTTTPHVADLTAEEIHAFTLAADMGANFYSRENCRP